MITTADVKKVVDIIGKLVEQAVTTTTQPLVGPPVTTTVDFLNIPLVDEEINLVNKLVQETGKNAQDIVNGLLGALDAIDFRIARVQSIECITETDNTPDDEILITGMSLDDAGADVKFVLDQGLVGTALDIGSLLGLGVEFTTDAKSEGGQPIPLNLVLPFRKNITIHMTELDDTLAGADDSLHVGIEVDGLGNVVDKFSGDDGEYKLVYEIIPISSVTDLPLSVVNRIIGLVGAGIGDPLARLAWRPVTAAHPLARICYTNDRLIGIDSVGAMFEAKLNGEQLDPWQPLTSVKVPLPSGTVTAIAAEGALLYVVQDGRLKLYRSDSKIDDMSTPNTWVDLGDSSHVTALAMREGKLYGFSNTYAQLHWDDGWRPAKRTSRCAGISMAGSRPAMFAMDSAQRIFRKTTDRDDEFWAPLGTAPVGTVSIAAGPRVVFALGDDGIVRRRSVA